jgi:hypothetical protein
MAFFDDMASAIRTYPDTNVVLDILDFDPISGDSLNESEEATFKVRITNSGLLDMTSVSVRVKGENDATIKRPLTLPGPIPTARAAAVDPEPVPLPTYVSELVSKSIAKIAANGGTATTEVFTLKAPADDTNAVSVNLLTVTLEGWNADLGFLLVSKSVARTQVVDTHSAVVHPL